MYKSRKFRALILTLFILGGIAGKVCAQDDDEPHGMYLETPRTFYAGFLAGANFAQVDGDNFAGYHKVGANLGVIAYAQLAKHVALSLEILYSQKGSRSIYGRQATDTFIFINNYSINLNYAEIPVMLNYFDKRKSHFGVGISYARLISGTESISTDPPTNAGLDKFPFKSYDINALAGVQLHLWKGFFLNVRFQYSLVPIRTDIPTRFARANQYNNLWTVRLMYLFI